MKEMMAQDNNQWLRALRELLGQNQVSVRADVLEAYSHDETDDLSYLPEIVAFPRHTEDVSAIMKLASKHRVPVTPSAARTGLAGGAIPVKGGIALSMKHFNRILDIDQSSNQATVEPGVINQVFQEACMAVGLMYPPDPSSWGSSTLGGNVATNAGGPRAVKYGVTAAYILNLEVVLPNGDIIWTGANTLKNSTGYNLTQLFVGSEGTLGVVTKIVCRLIPQPRHRFTLLAPFASAEAACAAVSKVFQAGITPSALEFMEIDAIRWAAKYTQVDNLPLGEGVQAHLLMEVDGLDEDAVMKEAEALASVVESQGSMDVLFAQSTMEREALWKLRRAVAEAVKSHSVYKEEDTVVPRAKLPELLRTVKSMGKTYGFQSVCYGHAGDGNLHVNIIKGDMTDADWHGDKLKQGIRQLFQAVVAMGGTLSGEHGIGLVQKDYLDIAFSESVMQLQRGIKELLDPLNIMNPGKIFPDA